MGHERVRFYCASLARAPRQIVLDIDDTSHIVHGHQQLRLFNAYYDEYGFQTVVVFYGDGRLSRVIRRHWPTTAILLRADGHYGTPKVLDLCVPAKVIRVVSGTISAMPGCPPSCC